MKRIYQFWVYCMTNSCNAILYIGVTNDLTKRVGQHKSREIKEFTCKYNCDKLVYFESFNQIEEAIAREKQLKNWKREWKNKLIDKTNPFWKDLSEKWNYEEDN